MLPLKCLVAGVAGNWPTFFRDSLPVLIVLMVWISIDLYNKPSKHRKKKKTTNEFGHKDFPEVFLVLFKFKLQTLDVQSHPNAFKAVTKATKPSMIRLMEEVLHHLIW